MSNPMDLREALRLISSSYDRANPAQYEQPAQILLDKASTHLGHYAPLGFKVGGSGQKPFRLTFTPWIGFLDTDESTTFMEGLYIVYLFSADLKRVYLSLNQGTEKLKKVKGLKTREQLELLTSNATAIRRELEHPALSKTGHAIDLAISSGRPRTYEAGNIVAIEYDSESLPSSAELVQELNLFFDLYEQAISIRNRLLLSEDSNFFGFNPNPQEPETVSLVGFRPKDDSSYRAEIKARSVTKSRRHETLVNHFGKHAQQRDFVASTPHPIDLLLQYEENVWIVEAKIIYGLNTAEAVRGAIAQLLEYRFFLKPNAELVALFDKPVGDAYLSLLNQLNVNVIWLENSEWQLQSKDALLLRIQFPLT